MATSSARTITLPMRSHGPVLWVLLALLASPGHAETVVPPGPVSGAWTSSGSPYRITGEITIPGGETLVIEPGVTVIFVGHHKFLVQGRLLAVGTALDSVRFTAGEPATGWHGIRFENTSAENDSSLFVYCLFEHGRAEGSYPDDNGGALYADGFGKIRVAHCSFHENTAAQGGALVCNSGGIVAGSHFIGNVATGSSGYPGAGSALRAAGATIVVRNDIQGNSAWNGGPTVTLNGSALLEANSICDNDGRGVECYGDCTSRIVNNTICSNSSVGIRSMSGANTEIVGCAICDNGGSGLYFSLVLATIINCTISGNHAQDGGGLFCSECDPIFINCILWGNTAVRGDQVYLHSYFHPSVDPDFHHCDIQGGVEAFGMYPGLAYEGRYEENIDTDPCFAGGGVHPYALTPQSYCVNAGRMEVEGLGLPPLDLAGAPRIYQGFRVDMGAYEYQGTPAFADMPVFAPVPGWYPEPELVALECPTPQASIHYTLDGSEPTQESPLYTDPLLVAAQATIRTRAFHTTLPPSLIASGTFRIGSDLAGVLCGTLPVAYSPYYIVGDLEVPIGRTLTLEPGVEMRFRGHHRLDVQGQLLAVGTPASRILFTADVPDSTWAGIRFDETPSLNDSSKIEHCVILQGEASGSEPDDHGGGIYVGGFSKLLVTHCHIRSCRAVKGGGMACDDEASPQILENIFEEDLAGEQGGGLYCGGGCAPAVIGNAFWANTAPQGGGLCAMACGSVSGPIRIENSEFHENRAVAGGTLIPAGGGLYVYDGSARLRGNLVTGNTSADYGAGIHVERVGADITGNVIIGNVGSGAGGGVACYVYSTGRVVDNLIYGNQALGGGGIFLSYGDAWEIANNTICENSATQGGGFLMMGYDARLVDCVLWGNAAPDGPQVAMIWQPNLEISYCDLQGGREAIGGDPYQPYLVYSDNMDEDPLFVGAGDWPFALDETSPCIDAGIPDTTGLGLPPADLAGNPRVSNGRVDLGAYEFPGTSGVDDRSPCGSPRAPMFALYPPRPNPVWGTARIAFAVPGRDRVRLCLYDPTGRTVRTLIDGVQPAGAAAVVWDGRNEQGRPCSAGVYFARLSSGKRCASRRVILAR